MNRLNFYLSPPPASVELDEAGEWNLQQMRLLLAEWGASDVESLSYAEAMRMLAAAVADAREGCYCMFDK